MIGLLAAGSEKTHCHHLACHSPYESPWYFAPGGMIPGLPALPLADAAIGDTTRTPAMKSTERSQNRTLRIDCIASSPYDNTEKQDCRSSRLPRPRGRRFRRRIND